MEFIYGGLTPGFRKEYPGYFACDRSIERRIEEVNKRGRRSLGVRSNQIIYIDLT